MQLTGWLGLPRFGFTPKPKTVSCVLSGGGSRASFQIGALRYLYRHDPQFIPTIFVGTSAGSIIASGLAQSADPVQQKAFVEQLWQLWTDLRTADEIFTPRSWLAKAQAEMPGWLGLMGSVAPSAVQPSPPPSSSGRGFTARLSFLRGNSAAASPELSDAPLEIDPLTEALEPDQEIRPDWSLGLLAQLAGQVGRLPRIGSDLASIRLGMEQTRSLYRPGPMLARILKPEVFDEAKVRTAGTTLRMSMVSLESGELRYMREDGVLVDRNERVVNPAEHSLTSGILASCCIPAVFRAVRIGAETYVDGGVRENIPAELAIGHLRAERTYLISSQTVGVPARQSMADAELFTVMMRSTEILMDEAGRDELAYAQSAGAIVIQPEIDVHHAMDVQPGLIDINIDYGWMRAAAELQDASQTTQERIRRLVALRMRCVQLEEELFDGADDARTGAGLAAAKGEIRDLVKQIHPELLPPGSSAWGTGFERHSSEPTIDPPWLDLEFSKEALD